MYLTYDHNYFVIDIEGNPIPSTRIWCCVCVNVVTKEVVRLVGEQEVRDWFNAQPRTNKYVGHNILGYDAPTLNRILGTKIALGQLIDTMVMSMLYNPSLDGGHSLEAWGNRLGYPKSKHEDFSGYSEDMLKYCERDTELCRRVFFALLKKMQKEGFTERGLELEHKSWFFIKQQQEAGFPFNYTEATILYAKLQDKIEELKTRIFAYWPPELKIVKTFAQARKKDGTYTKNFLTHQQMYPRLQETNDGGYYAYDYVEFNLASPDQRRDKLLELGWKPQEFTKPSKTHPKGQAKVTDKGELVPSLQRFVEESGREEVRLVATWIDLNSRATMINTWMEAYNHDTGRIHGSLWLANTLRYKHSNPNTANIPAVRLDRHGQPLKEEAGVYTYEARDLWTCSDPVNRRLVGVDAKGIQLRVLAHYLNNPEFTEAVLNGDPHSYNQRIGGFRDRPTAKTFIYAFLLGAGDAKVGQIVGGTPRDGKQLKQRFIGNFPGLNQLLRRLEQEVNRTGRIRLCDGTPIVVTQPHTRLGYLLQGDENRIMKKAAVLTKIECLRRNLDVIKVGDIHDEWQSDVLADHVPELTQEVYPFAFRSSGEFFDYRLPVACDAKVGLTWAETH
jgi:DNA polymerase I